MTLVLTQKSHKCLMGFTLFSLCFCLSQQKDRACSICYLDLIIKGIGKQVIFKQKSLKQHYVKCHPKYESIKKSKI